MDSKKLMEHLNEQYEHLITCFEGANIEDTDDLVVECQTTKGALSRLVEAAEEYTYETNIKNLISLVGNFGDRIEHGEEATEYILKITERKVKELKGYINSYYKTEGVMGEGYLTDIYDAIEMNCSIKFSDPENLTEEDLAKGLQSLKNLVRVSNNFTPKQKKKYSKRINELIMEIEGGDYDFKHIWNKIVEICLVINAISLVASTATTVTSEIQDFFNPKELLQAEEVVSTHQERVGQDAGVVKSDKPKLPKEFRKSK
ncbi:hypothetical protein KAR91_81745 [Candidatus Pacearchaeota archaeon]|nr:hypothetical protein [Candidatus Pacearchaeota archaeon]